MPQALSDKEWQHPRGVFRTRYKIQGCWGLVAIDSRGEGRKKILLRAGVDELRATYWLRQWLDRIDPIPQLQLIKPNDPVGRAPLELTPHPCQRDNHLSHALRVSRRETDRLFRYD